jgi:transcriptional regulator with XRE-family HTH domain
VESFGAAVRRLLQNVGMSQVELAERVHISAPQLSRLLNGHRGLASDVAQAIDDALDAQGALVTLARAEHPRLPDAGSDRPLDQTDAYHIREDVARLVGLDTRHGSTGLLPVAQHILDPTMTRLARVGATEGARSEVYAAVADLAAVTSWIAADALRYDVAEPVALRGLMLAEISGDPRLKEFLLSHLAMVAEHRGRRAESLAYADRGLHAQPSLLRVQAMFRLRRARALGGAGVTDEALLEWERARQLIDTAAERAEWDSATYWLGDAEMSIHRSLILGAGGRNGEAVEWAHQSVAQLLAHQGRDRELLHVLLLEALLSAHQWGEATTLVERFLAWPSGVMSARVPESLHRSTEIAQVQRAPHDLRDATRAAFAAASR